MYGEKVLGILIKLQKAAATVDDIAHSLDSIAPPRGMSFGAVLRGEHRKPRQKSDPNSLYQMLYRLHQDGLIERIGRGSYQISQAGRTRLKTLKQNKSHYKPFDVYPVVHDKITRIVSFDIPEHRRKQRAWLRGALVHLEFKMRQQSFWIGDTKLPDLFIKDLSDLRLLSYVEIFSVTKQGTLKEIV